MWEFLNIEPIFFSHTKQANYFLFYAIWQERKVSSVYSQCSYKLLFPLFSFYLFSLSVCRDFSLFFISLNADEIKYILSQPVILGTFSWISSFQSTIFQILSKQSTLVIWKEVRNKLYICDFASKAGAMALMNKPSSF